MTRERINFEVALLTSVLLHVTAVAGFQHREALIRAMEKVPLTRLINAWEARHAEARVLNVLEQPEMQTLTFVEAPRTFMETTPDQVVGGEPTDAKYYSDKSTVAANRENPTGATGSTPYLSGSETRMASAADVTPSTGAGGLTVPLLSPASAAPATPPQELSPQRPPSTIQSAEAPSASMADVGLNVTDRKQQAMQVLPADATPSESSQFPAQSTPPAVAAPTMRSTPSAVRPPGAPGTPPGREIATMKSHLTASGVARIGVDAFNVAASPFGEYDQKMVRAVQSRWYALIEEYALYERSGTVTITFEVHEDGTVHNLQRMENLVGDLLASFCEKAILDSTPFEPLPDRLRLLLGNQPREASFTFYY